MEESDEDTAVTVLDWTSAAVTGETLEKEVGATVVVSVVLVAMIAADWTSGAGTGVTDIVAAGEVTVEDLGGSS